ncbi:MAG: DUF4277 domain-containing protein [Hormoscilla sp. GM102CHS1]|nr:DUF4277 domain-containing protein [Hormoscilla sp. GM102CHS1]
MEHLIGKGVNPDDLNDDKLGRVDDKLSARGTGEILIEVV